MWYGKKGKYVKWEQMCLPAALVCQLTAQLWQHSLLWASVDSLQFLQHYHLAGNQQLSGKNSKKGQAVLADTIYLAFSLFLPLLEKHPGKCRGREQLVGIPAVLLPQTLARLLSQHVSSVEASQGSPHPWLPGASVDTWQSSVCRAGPATQPDGRELSPGLCILSAPTVNYYLRD